MKSQSFLFVLTLVNLGLFGYQATQFGSGQTSAADSILRGTGIEIVDSLSRVRAQIKVEPANPTFVMPDGAKGYPETVIFRLITADGKPRVKLTTSEESSNLMLLGAGDTTQTILQADGEKTSLKLRNNEATQRLLQP